jgi:putative endonuclease
MMYYVYVLYSSKFNKIYIGQTDNLCQRLERHNRGLVRYTKPFIPWRLLHHEIYRTRGEAMIRERELKSHKGRDYIKNNWLNGRVRQVPD